MGEFSRHLIAAQGYLELGMCDDAALELEEMPAEFKTNREVLIMRTAIYHAAKRWHGYEAACAQLARMEPDNANWWSGWAYGARRTKSITDAAAILRKALKVHPDTAHLLYNLACYCAQLGELEESRCLLKRAISFDAEYQALAFDDPDLDPLWKHFGKFSE
jgi:tetratricopeptide (TPR) repeat protein